MSPYLPGPELFISPPISAIQTRPAYSSARFDSSLSSASSFLIGYSPVVNPMATPKSNLIPSSSASFYTESSVVEDLVKWGFGYLIGWFVGGIGCTLQTLYAWLMRGFGMVGILIYRVLHLSLGCDSWYACYVINLVK